MSRSRPRKNVFTALTGALLFVSCPALASDTPDPSTVTIAGDLQDELGCSGDWQPDCAVTHLAFDAEDIVWQAIFNVPAGNWQYKAALNDSWDENYGDNATRDGPNISLDLADPTAGKFYYSHETHWVTDNVNSIIAVAPGSFQSELGCASDWDPGCLRSWLQDPDGDGVFTFNTSALPAGNYEVKVAIGESWDQNYGAGGVQNGPNIPFTVPSDCTPMLFSFDWATKILSIGSAPPPPQPMSVTMAGSFQFELGCPGDWQPDCALTHLTFDGEDGVWQGTFSLPAGSWEYKAALNDSWDQNYGANAQQNGPNIGLNLADPTDVKFYYSHETHWVTDNQGFLIVTAPGSYQSEIGCSGDWQPWCLRSWLQDPDGDGIFAFSIWLPAGYYETKATIDESWDENYGEGGVQDGPNIPFTVPASCTEVFFAYDDFTHVLSIGTAAGIPDIDVFPLTYNFGDVTLGDSAVAIIDVTNSGTADLTIADLTVSPTGAVFSIVTPPTLPVVLQHGDLISVQIEFVPPAAGIFSAQLGITSDDPFEPLVTVDLSGNGVIVEVPPNEQIEGILDFIEESVASGSLDGDGPGNSAQNRLNALIHMIEAAGELITLGDYAEACEQLWSAYRKCDGVPKPPDFVTGDAAGELAQRIIDLREDLGCE